MSEHIRNLVQRCYNVLGPIGLEPNALDGQNPASEFTPASASSSGPAPQQTPSEIIQTLVGRCYGPPVVNQPNPLDSLNIPVRPDPPEAPEVPTPAEVIQDLVGRCYPELPPQQPPKPPADLPDLPTIVNIDPIICFVQNELGIELPGIECGKDIIIKWPTSDVPDGPWISTGDDDCKRVSELRVRGKVEYIGGKKWRVIGSDPEEILICDTGGGGDGDWEKCVRNTLACTFKPYLGGGWTPAKIDCEGYHPRGWSANKTEVCIKNCFPERLPVYESENGGEYNYHNESSGPSGYSLTNSEPAWWVLKDKIGGRAGGVGLNVELITNRAAGFSNEENNPPIKTTNKQGVGNGNWIYNEGGAKFWPKKNTGLPNGNAVRGDIAQHTIRYGRATINFEVRPVYRISGGDVDDIDSEWRVTSWEGTLPESGVEIPFTFMPKQNGKDGQQIMTIYAVILGPESREFSVPLFKYKGNQSDHFLTTNPGEPDTEGKGERATMNSAGMVFHSILGYVFQRKGDGISYISNKEKLWALHRFYNPSTKDHRYTIDPQNNTTPQRVSRSRFAYRIPQKITNALTIRMDVEKGKAGYDNAFGFYLADSSGPKWGKIVVPSAKEASQGGGNETSTITLSVSELEAYAGGTMGFFLLSDGAGQNSLSTNQTFSINSHSNGHGPGFRGSGIDTKENDYILFSDKKWNPEDEKDYTKWKGPNKQMWEDLIDGDDDYDDLILWHTVEFTAYPGYRYEGVQCYVYAEDRPEPVMLKIDLSNPCDGQAFKKNFKDVVLQRQECGNYAPLTYGEWDENHECGRCTGDYTISQGRDQTITCVTGGRFRLKSFGGITGGTNGDCMRFKMRMKKNGSTIFNDRYDAGAWPTIGQDLYDGDINLSPGDKLSFKLMEIRSGPPTGSITPYCSLYNVDTGKFEMTWGLSLSTASGDTPLSPRMMANTQLLTIGAVGAVRGMDLQFYPSNTASSNAKSDGKLRAGSYSGDAWHNSARDNKKSSGPKQASTEVFENGIRKSMHGLLQNQSSTPPGPEVLGGAERNQFNPLLPNISGGYIDTGYPEDPVSEYRSASKAYRLQVIGGDYSDLLKRHLITRFDEVDGTFAQRGAMLANSPVHFARREKPWYEVANTRAAASLQFPGHTQSPQDHTFFNANTFIQDYYLDGNEYENDAIPDGAAAQAMYCKVRVGFTFYSSKAIPAEAGSPEGGSDYPEHWMCAITVLEMLQTGIGYSEGMEFDLFWPPKRYNQGASGPLSAYFLADGSGIRVDGSGTGTIELEFDWDDNPSQSGQAVGTLEIEGQTFDQGNNTTGNQTRSFSVTGGTTYNWTITGQNTNYETARDAFNAGDITMLSNYAKTIIVPGWENNPQYLTDPELHQQTVGYFPDPDSEHGRPDRGFTSLWQVDADDDEQGFVWLGGSQSGSAGFRIRDGGQKIQWDDDASNGFDVNATMVIKSLDTNGGGGQSADAAYNAMESPDVSPFYPDMKGNFKLPKKLAAFYEKDGQKRAAKEAIYQESHNKNSPVWYTSSDRDKHRIRFKLIITQTT